MNKETEKRIILVKRRFIKLHGESKWTKLNYLVFKQDLSISVVARGVKLSRDAVRYWIQEIVDN
jgi:hypothetical protein